MAHRRLVLPSLPHTAALVALGCLAAFSGCMAMNLGMPALPFAKKQTVERDDFAFESNDSVDPPMIGDHVTFSGLNLVTLEGVGLVTGLPGTGEDPPASQYRTALLDDMRRRGVENPNQILQSPSTALVIVRAYLPPLVKKGDRFDVEVRVPERSEVQSLNGGWLMECFLTEHAVVAGRGVMEGHTQAKAAGPILVSTGEGKSAAEVAGLLKRGSIVGGAVSLAERDMQILLNDDFRSGRNAQRIGERIGQRFYAYDKYGHRESLAEAKTDHKIILRIQDRYGENFPHYINVLQNIAFKESDVQEQVRMERLAKELLVPATAQRSAVQLEALGPRAIDSLKKALASPWVECRFFAAQSLAYLDDSSGLEVLAQAAKDEPAFRIFAFAAMAATGNAEAFVYLRELVSEPSLETRYGAFRTMTEIDEQDPLVRGRTFDGGFKLHALPCTGEPMIHLTHRQKMEIVLFGDDQEVRTPLAVRAGKDILVTAREGDDRVTIAQHQVGKSQERVVSLKLADIIAAVAELGASYPDVAQMLAQANRQKNLPGRIGIDELPLSGRTYHRPSDPQGIQQVGGTAAAGTDVKIGRGSISPNLFPARDAQTTPLLLNSEALAAPTADELKSDDQRRKDELSDNSANPFEKLKSVLGKEGDDDPFEGAEEDNDKE